MTPSFNLVDEPWIPCLLPNGDTMEVSLLKALVQAHEIKEIFDLSPLVVIALHRLLLAILHRNFGPESLTAWQELWQRGCWDEAKLRSYLDRWRHRFDLFHPERPFYQVIEMVDAKKHPAHILALEAAAPNNPTLFDHNFSTEPVTFTPANATRILLARQAYSIGFGKSTPFYFKDSPMIRGYSILSLGDNLWETLALNLVAYNQERPIPLSGEDLPVWEKEILPNPAENGNPITGYVDYLTWQSRRIHLFPEGNPLAIRWCQVQQNLMLPEPFPFDPFKSYLPDKEKGWRPRNMVSEKAVWRDSHALFQAGDQSMRRPGVLDWVGRIWSLREAGKINAKKTYGFLAVGLVTEIGKAANIVLWRQERLPLPLSYLEDNPQLLNSLAKAISLAEDISRILNSSLFQMAQQILSPEYDPKTKQGRKPDTQNVRNLLKIWAPERLYFAQLETPFRKLLVEMPEDRHEDEDGDMEYGRRSLPQWGLVLRDAASISFKTITSGLGVSPRALKAVAQAEDRFRRFLHTEIRKLSTGGEHEPEK